MLCNACMDSVPSSNTKFCVVSRVQSQTLPWSEDIDFLGNDPPNDTPDELWLLGVWFASSIVAIIQRDVRGKGSQRSKDAGRAIARPTILCEGIPLENVVVFKYLGNLFFWLQPDGQQIRDVDARIAHAFSRCGELHNVFNSKSLSKAPALRGSCMFNIDVWLRNLGTDWQDGLFEKSMRQQQDGCTHNWSKHRSGGAPYHVLLQSGPKKSSATSQIAGWVTFWGLANIIGWRIRPCKRSCNYNNMRSIFSWIPPLQDIHELSDQAKDRCTWGTRVACLI